MKFPRTRFPAAAYRRFHVPLRHIPPHVQDPLERTLPGVFASDISRRTTEDPLEHISPRRTRFGCTLPYRGKSSRNAHPRTKTRSKAVCLFSFVRIFSRCTKGKQNGRCAGIPRVMPSASRRRGVSHTFPGCFRSFPAKGPPESWPGPHRMPDQRSKTAIFVRIPRFGAVFVSFSYRFSIDAIHGSQKPPRGGARPRITRIAAGTHRGRGEPLFRPEWRNPAFGKTALFRA